MKPCRYLRIRLTERCNLSCRWCHHEGGSAEPIKSELSAREIKKVVQFLSTIGYKKIKLAGGEPTLRKDLPEIIQELTSIAGIEISMISNGTLLTEARLRKYYESGLRRINLSINTVRPDLYAQWQGGKLRQLNTVLDSVQLLPQMGFEKPKINMIYQGSKSEEDLIRLLEIAASCQVKITLLNLLPGIPDNGPSATITTASLIDLIVSMGVIQTVVDRDDSSFPTICFKMRNGAVIEIGHHQAGQEGVYQSCKICEKHANCLESVYSHRLTPDGRLQPCLIRNDNCFDLGSFVGGQVDQATILTNLNHYYGGL